jgi:hypothetical protein
MCRACLSLLLPGQLRAWSHLWLVCAILLLLRGCLSLLRGCLSLLRGCLSLLRGCLSLLRGCLPLLRSCLLLRGFRGGSRRRRRLFILVTCKDKSRKRNSN